MPAAGGRPGAAASHSQSGCAGAAAAERGPGICAGRSAAPRPAAQLAPCPAPGALPPGRGVSRISLPEETGRGGGAE